MSFNRRIITIITYMIFNQIIILSQVVYVFYVYEIFVFTKDITELEKGES